MICLINALVRTGIIWPIASASLNSSVSTTLLISNGGDRSVTYGVRFSAETYVILAIRVIFYSSC